MKNLLSLSAQLLFAVLLAAPLMLVWDFILVPLTYFEPISYLQMLGLVIAIRCMTAKLSLDF
ncbi:MAG: hypothetical protein KGI54_14845 [Pseudomonadota bacterium]|nr:hypothetical protein [Pseudomonadota bacterium]